jgi:hypothetical protein
VLGRGHALKAIEHHGEPRGGDPDAMIGDHERGRLAGHAHGCLDRRVRPEFHRVAEEIGDHDLEADPIAEQRDGLVRRQPQLAALLA